MTRSKSTPPIRRPPTQTGSLIRKLTGHPHLPSYIKQLPACSLNRLIDTVGLEDSQEILALMASDRSNAMKLRHGRFRDAGFLAARCGHLAGVREFHATTD